MMVSCSNLLLWSFPLVFLLSWTVQCVAAVELRASCINPDGHPGKCIYTADCKPIMNFIEQGLTYSEYLFLDQSRCDKYNYQKQMVCCAETGGLLLEPPNCGKQWSDYESHNQTTFVNEHPWTALLKLDFWSIATHYNCSGTLINKRYVLTAAHCITSIRSGWKLSSVRLGEWNLHSKIDCEDGYCNDVPIDVGIEKIIVHKDYSSVDNNYHNDIALIRLDRDVKFSSSIIPICLPLSSADYPREDMFMYSAGWHKDGILKKLKTELKIVDAENCSQIHQHDGISLQSTQLCASAVRLNDTCSGNSGGPLMQKKDGLWYLFGVAGLLVCGENGVPDVYTNITLYIDWIRDNIRQ